MNVDSKFHPVVVKVQRFTVTGVLTTGLHVIVAVILIEQLAATPPLANGVAFILATIFSYAVNTLWSFSSRPRRKNIIRFVLVSLIGAGVAVVVSDLANQYGLDYMIGIAMVVVTVPPITFMLHNFWTYR